MTGVTSESIVLFVNTALLLLMCAAALGVVRLRNLFAVVMLGGVYSFLMASLMVALDAVDVGMTEAAVGAGISVVLMLSVLGLTKTREAAPRHRPLVALVVSAVVAVSLLYASGDLPPFGDPAAPAHQHVAPEYLARAPVETGAPNIVTAVLASYRGYDTLGETAVILTGGIGVLVLLLGARRRRGGVRQGGAGESPEGTGAPMLRDTVILRVGAKILLPFILLFALYVQFHGDFGPGGGFQAGVAAATGVVLYALVFGVASAQRVAPVRVVLVMVPLGVLIYAGTGLAGMLAGGNYLDYSVLAHDPVHGQHWGIFAVESGVFVTVSGTMLAIFYAFAGRRQAREEEGAGR